MRRSPLRVRTALWLASLGLPTIPSCTLAQVAVPGAATPVNLEQTLAAAIANYPAVRASQALQRAAQGAIDVSKTAYLPRTDMLWQTNRATANNILGLLLPQATIPSVTGSVLPPDPTRSAWNSAGGALVTWQPFDFGARAAKVAAAREGSEAARQAVLLTQLQVSANAGSAFFDLAAAEQLVTAATQNLQRSETFSKAVHVLVDNTLRPGADATEADAQLALARNQLIQVETQVEVKRAALAEYLQTKPAQSEIDAALLLASVPETDIPTADSSKHPLVLQEEALTMSRCSVLREWCLDVAAAEGVLAQAESDDAIARLGVWRAEFWVAVAHGDVQPFLRMLQSQAKGK